MASLSALTETATITFVDRQPRLSDFRADALEGLTARPKRLPPKYFYDKRGSELFERITELPEYYLTRAEIEILERRAAEIAELIGDEALLIEYGSGASRKTRILLNALAGRRAKYLAIDISRQHLEESAEALAKEYAGLEVFALCADYTQPLELPEEALAGIRRRTVFFPGSTIGNFSPGDARKFLRTTARTAGPGGRLLLGADLKKDRALLEAAYNDAAGVTAEFNLNLLARMNRELGAGFEASNFRHRARYDEAAGRVEMHLESLSEQRVRIGGETIAFEAGELIHTENSHKFGIDEMQDLARECGFEPEQVWIDAKGLFSVHSMRVG